MIVMNEVDNHKDILKTRRGELLREIAECADAIKRIDDELKLI
jgi:hypothetical protein